MEPHASKRWLGQLLTTLVALPVLAGAQDEEGRFIESATGYFPTQSETVLLSGASYGGAGYPRSRGYGGQANGPDQPAMTSSGIWAYDSPDENFYQRNAWLFEPLDNVLGIFAPRESLTLESSQAPYTELSLDPALPFTRQFSPDMAHLKAGPFYLDLLSVSTKVLYSDFNSPDRELAYDDGWLAVVDLTARLYGRITDNLYFSLAGTVYYLPNVNRWGVDLTASSRSFARLNWERQLGSWYVHFFNEFRVVHRMRDFLDPLEIDEIDRAGRYRFGRPDHTRTNGYFDDRSLVYRNVVGLHASTLMTPNWRFNLALEHTDFWETTDFSNHHNTQRIEALLGYEGSDLIFSPYLSYTGLTKDEFDSMKHRVWLGGYGRLTENVRANARVGYYWLSGDSSASRRGSWLYEAGLVHEINEDTTHSIYGGLVWTDDRFGDDGLYNYARYTLAHQFSSRVRGQVFVMGQDRQDVEDRTRWSVGGDSLFLLTDYTQLKLILRHEDTHYSTGADSNRWLVRAALRHRLASRLYGTLSYQFEDFYRRGSSFEEHLYYLSLTRYF